MKARTGLMLAALAASPLLTLPAAAQTFDDRPNTLSPVLGFLGLGGDDAPDRGDIDFRERPRLVVPKSTDLPPPRPGASTRVANWPQDQDLARRREDVARARVPSQINVNANPALSQSELMRGRSNDAPVAVSLCDTYIDGMQDCAPTAMEKIKRVFTIGDANRDTVIVGKEPDRKYMTEPPSGYRSATRTTKATMEGGTEREDASNPGAYYRDMEKRNSAYR